MTKSTVIPLAVIAVLLAAIAGYVVGKHGGTAVMQENTATAPPAPKRKILYWKAPMDPNYHSDKPGKSPMGMDLVPVYADENSGEAASDVKIAPEVVDSLGVRTAEVRRGTLSRRLDLVGYVGYDQDTITSVNSRAAGWVEKLGVKSAGDTVHAGQVLYALFSPKMATAEREYLTALASGSRPLIAASRDRMRALGFTATQIERLAHTHKVSENVLRRADSSGVLMSLGVSEGAYVMPATQIMKLADLHTVWVLVEVDESDAALLHKGQKADAVFDAFPGEHWHGVVDYVYPDVSTSTRTIKARLRFPNPDLRLQPNMYAHVTIQGTPQRDALYIPSQALIRTGHSQRVIVALGGGRFDVCPVEAGFTMGDRVEILKGLWAGERVVTSAQFMIDSEANVDAAALRLGGGKPGCTANPETAEPGAAGKGMPGMDMSGKAMPKGSGTRHGGTSMPMPSAGDKGRHG